MAARLPLIVIVGPTASGKTSLAIKLAKKFHGEIICADSRTIYKDMNIGTAKPTVRERELVPHWGLDLVEPGERFTAADFQKYAQQKIVEIRKRGHVPFLVGGTGLYINSVLYDFTFQVDYDEEYRQKLETMTIEELIKYCVNNNVILPENRKNKRYLIRAIETKNASKSVNTTLIENLVVVGISSKSKEERDTIITQRAKEIMNAGVVEEATFIAEKYGWDNQAMTGNIYPLIQKHIEGDLTQAELLEQFITADRKLAKRQMTWFKRDTNIRWLIVDDAYSFLAGVLSEH